MIVIHIGMPKAGSTTIQYFLRENEEALRQLSIDYPLIGREYVEGSFKHGDIAREVQSAEPKGKYYLPVSSALRSYMKIARYAKTILSSESFCQLSRDDIRIFRLALSKDITEYRIIFVIRDLLSSVPSAYAQRVKYGARSYDFDSFFAQRIDSGSMHHLNIAKRWANVFGWDALHVRLLDPATLIGGDLITDFMASCGMDNDDPRLAALPRPPRANESPGWKTIEAVRAVFNGRSGLRNDHLLMNTPLPRKRLERRKFGSVAQAVAQEMGWNGERGLYMTSKQSILCIKQFSRRIRKLNEFLVRKVPAPLELDQGHVVGRPFLPDVSHINASELRAFYDKWAARLEGS